MVLQKCGVHDTILHAILGLYTNPNARVLTSGMRSSLFRITNGTHQGCPLSPLIFALIIEPSAQAMHSRPNITGLLLKIPIKLASMPMT